MNDRTAELNARDDLRELAERYETVAALDTNPGASIGHAPPGPRLPPGMNEILDQDEISRVLHEIDDWADFLTRTILEETDTPARPWPGTPQRIRFAAEHAAHFTNHPDLMLAVAFDDDLHNHLRHIRRLAGRAARRIPTHHRCTLSSCDGMLVSTLGEATDGALQCDKCGNRVPHVVWSAWPKRLTYISPDHAAKMLGCTVQAVWQRAKRGKWRRVGTGSDVQYLVEDVRKAATVTA